MLMHISRIQKNGTDKPICRAGIETQYLIINLYQKLRVNEQNTIRKYVKSSFQTLLFHGLSNPGSLGTQTQFHTFSTLLELLSHLTQGHTLLCHTPGEIKLCYWTVWRKKWQPTPVFLPGESHGRRSLVGYSPWGRKESDMIERLQFTSLDCQNQWQQKHFSK